MKKNKRQKFNSEANELFRDKVFIPMVTFAVGLMVFTVLLDYTFQFIDAIDWLVL